jgi:hypothetical protein
MENVARIQTFEYCFISSGITEKTNCIYENKNSSKTLHVTAQCRTVAEETAIVTGRLVSRLFVTAVRGDPGVYTPHQGSITINPGSQTNCYNAGRHALFIQDSTLRL